MERPSKEEMAAWVRLPATQWLLEWLKAVPVQAGQGLLASYPPMNPLSRLEELGRAQGKAAACQALADEIREACKDD